MSDAGPFDIDPREMDQPPIERAETIPSHWYTSPAMHRLERRYLFPASWQLVGHISQVPEPGDSLQGAIAGNPVIVVRDRDQQLNAFFNVCRHQGGPVCVKKGTRSMLQCQYHGWTYQLDGTLRGVPQFDRVELFDKADYGLKPVALAEWEGLIFLHLGADPKPLESYLNGIADRIGPVDLSTFHHAASETYQIACNWKVYVDNFLEGYHIPIVHPELADLLDYRQYRTETHDWYSLQYSPFQEKENIYGETGGKAYYYFLFPNMMLNILPGRLQTNVVRPVSADHCEVEFHYYYQQTDGKEALRRIQDDVAYSDRIQQEDIEICEKVQRGLASLSYDKGRFSPETEQGVYHFQSLLKQELRQTIQPHDNHL